MSPASRLSRVAAVLLAALGSCWSARAHADASPPVVLWIEGPHADEARAEITKSFGTDVTLADPAPWHDAFVRSSPKDAHVTGIASPTSRARMLERIRRAAASVSADEVVIVITTRARGHHVADAYLVGKDGEADILTHLAFGEAGAPLGTAVHDKIVASRPPPPPVVVEPPVAPAAQQPVVSALTTEPVPARDAVVAPHGRPKHVVGRNLFDVAVGVEFGGRQFSSGGADAGTLRDYWLGAAPLPVASAAIYPLADLRVPVLADLGVVGGYEQAVGLSSQSTVNGSVGTTWSRWYVGGRLRVRTGGPNAPLLGVIGAYGSESFTFSTTSDNSGTYPSATYDYLRLGGDVRVPLGPIAASASGAYLAILSTSGAVVAPGAAAYGAEFGVGLSVEVTTGLEARLGATYRRYFSGPTLDEFWGMTVALAYVY